MKDPRLTKLAETLVDYSCEVAEGEKVLVEAVDVPHEFTTELVRVVRRAGGSPLVTLKSVEVQRALLLHGSDDQWELTADVERHRMENVQCYIGVRGNPNVNELSDVEPEAMKRYEKTVWKRVHHEVRVKKTRWVVLRWPSPSMAQLASMAISIKAAARPSMPIAQAMDGGEQVHDPLAFPNRNIPSIIARSCCGSSNPS